MRNCCGLIRSVPVLKVNGGKLDEPYILPFLQDAKHLLHLHLLMKLATHVSTRCAIRPSLSNFVLCHLSFCFALRLSELLLHMQLAKPEWIVHCVQTTPPSFFAYINFLILIPKFCFITAPFFFPPHRRSHLVLPGPTTVGSFQPRDKVTKMGKAQAHLYPHPFH